MKITVVIPLGKDRELDFLKEFDREKNNVKVIIVKGANPSANRNKGAKRAKTELIAFVNSHTILSDNWANKVEDFFKEHPDIDIVGGPQLAPKDSSFFEKVSDYGLSSIFGAAVVAQRYKRSRLNLDADETMITSANLICRREVLEKVEFDERIYPGEDPKFIADAKKSGFRVAYSPNIIVYNKRRRDFPSFMKQIYNYGATRPEKESLTKTILKRPFFLVPSLFLMYLVLLMICLMTNWLDILNLPSFLNFLLLSPIILYVVLSLSFSLINSFTNRNLLAFFVLPFVYLSIHLSYGWGFFVSTLKSIFEKRK